MFAEIAALQEIHALAVVAPILIYIIVDDLRTYRIRNEAILALLALFVAFYLFKGDIPSLKEHLTFGLLLFAVFLGMYWLRMMGGGDVKLLAVACFWLGLENAMMFAVFLSAFSLVYAHGAKFGLLPSRTGTRGTKVPFGPSIALAWMSALLVRIAA